MLTKPKGIGYFAKQNLPPQAGANFHLGPIAAPNRAGGGNLEQKSPGGGVLKNSEAMGKNEVGLVVKFKGLWVVVAEESKKTTQSLSTLCANSSLWLRLKEFARAASNLPFED